MKEVFKKVSIKGLENIEVSNTGKVRDIKRNRLLKLQRGDKNKRRSPEIKVKQQSFRLSRLMALAFGRITEAQFFDRTIGCTFNDIAFYSLLTLEVKSLSQRRKCAYPDLPNYVTYSTELSSFVCKKWNGFFQKTIAISYTLDDLMYKVADKAIDGDVLAQYVLKSNHNAI
jgi:hypothetical protein